MAPPGDIKNLPMPPRPAPAAALELAASSLTSVVAPLPANMPAIPGMNLPMPPNKRPFVNAFLGSSPLTKAPIAAPIP